MNKFEQAYLNIINEWNSNILLEANLKSLIPLIQDTLLIGQTYQDLNEEKKEELQKNITTILGHIERKVNGITDNKQYQSWIYNILKNKDVNYLDLKPIENAIFEFNKLTKRPDLKPNQKNIQNYNSFNDLLVFIDNFKDDHKLQNNIYNNLKKIYQNKEFTVYFINPDQYEECNKLFGGTKYFNTGWCIAKNKEHFDRYIYESKDKFNGYFVFIKDNKPYALLHYGSGQFKDTSDKPLKSENSNIIDCLYNINNNIKDYENDYELLFYKELILNDKNLTINTWLKQHPDKTKKDYIANQIGGEYDLKTNTLDCKGNHIRFKNEWLNDEGIFDFNLINLSDNLNLMFYICTDLKKLSDNFIIPEGTTSCTYMFQDCVNLTELPNSFILPNSINNCYCMFYNCFKLKKLPDNFTIPNNVKDCYNMFNGCIDLKELPKNFTIPKNSNYDNIFKNSGLENKYNLKDLLK